DGTLLVNLKLRFNDSHREEKLALSVYNTIDVGATKHYIDSLTYVVIKDFLVDIRVNGKYAYDGIDVEIRLPVFNLNYSKQLEDTSSKQFQTLADPFCLDVMKILSDITLSPFYNRVYKCSVLRFSTHPDRVNFKIHFTGKDWRHVQKALPYYLISSARNVTYHGQSVKMIGDLIITPYNIYVVLKPTNVTQPTTATTTTAATSSSTRKTTDL
ncbi:fibrillin-2-like isoform X6, partial [Biomphalaria pfeifferi]